MINIKNIMENFILLTEELIKALYLLISYWISQYLDVSITLSLFCLAIIQN